MKKTILVTGASGFVGQAFIKRFSNEFNIVPVSLRDKKPDSIDFSKIDVVLHLAGLAHSTKRIPAEKYFEVNTTLTAEMARAAKAAGVKQFIFLSTVKVYGEDGWFDCEGRVLTVDSACHPVDPYGQSKLAAEQAIMPLADDTFCVSIVRPCLIYRADAKGNIASLVKLMKLLRVIPLGYRNNRRSILQMDELLSCLNRMIVEGEEGVCIPRAITVWSLDSMLRSLALDLRIRVFILPVPRFLVAIVSMLRPHVAKRLFGDLLFESGRSSRKILKLRFDF